CVAHVVASRVALRQQSSRLANVPVVLIRLERYQFEIGSVVQIEGAKRRRLAIRHAKDSARSMMDAIGLVALAGVRPVGDVHGAIGAGEEVEAAKPFILHEKEIVTVQTDVTGATPLQQVVVQPAAVEVQREHRVTVAIGPIIALVDHQSAMGMAAASRGGGVAHGQANVAPFLSGVTVNMVGRLSDESVKMWIEIGAVHSLVVSARHEVPQMADHGVDEKHLAMPVEIEAPRVGRAMGDDFEDAARRVIAPDTAIHTLAL